MVCPSPVYSQLFEVIRQALVLLCDHELNPSTFAVRVCASTGTSLPAALLAGMATLSGTRHGGVAGATMQAVTAQMAGQAGGIIEVQHGRFRVAKLHSLIAGWQESGTPVVVIQRLVAGTLHLRYQHDEVRQIAVE